MERGLVQGGVRDDKRMICDGNKFGYVYGCSWISMSLWYVAMLSVLFFQKKYIFASCSSLFQGSAAMRLLTHPVVWWACLFCISHMIPFSWPSTTCSLATMAGHVLCRGEGQVANPVVKMLASEGATVTKKKKC